MNLCVWPPVVAFEIRGYVNEGKTWGF